MVDSRQSGWPVDETLEDFKIFKILYKLYKLYTQIFILCDMTIQSILLLYAISVFIMYLYNSIFSVYIA